jgi:hypothetical protein
MKVNYVNSKKETTPEIKTSNPQEQQICLVCYEPIKYFAVLECDHTDVCWKCLLTQRELMLDKSCPVCKQDTAVPVFTKLAPKLISDYNKKDMIYDEKFKFYTPHKEIILACNELRSFVCYLCSSKGKNRIFSSYEEAKAHQLQAHSLHYCDLCVKHRKVFMNDQKLYSSAQLKNHLKMGEVDKDYGLIKGHPLCRFCDKRFYSDDDILEHMHLGHYECHICKAQQILFEYFENYAHLQSHFEEQHYACTHPFCLEQRFIVFTNELDLLAHESKVHSKGRDKKNMLFFGTTVEKEKFVNARKHRPMGQQDATCIRFVGARGGEYNAQHKPTPKGSNEPDHTLEIKYKKQELEVENMTDEERMKKNQELILEMKNMLKSEKMFAKFKEISQAYQKGMIMAMEYYRMLVTLFGKENAATIVPKLIALMPPNSKQKGNALKLVHETYKTEVETIVLQFDNKNTKMVQREQKEQDWPSLGDMDNGKKNVYVKPNKNEKEYPSLGGQKVVSSNGQPLQFGNLSITPKTKKKTVSIEKKDVSGNFKK